MQAPREAEQPPAPASAPQSPFAEGDETASAAPQPAEPEAQPPPRAPTSDMSAADRRTAIEKADALIKHGLEVFNRGQPEQARRLQRSAVRFPLTFPAFCNPVIDAGRQAVHVVGVLTCRTPSCRFAAHLYRASAATSIPHLSRCQKHYNMSRQPGLIFTDDPRCHPYSQRSLPP